MSDVRSCKGGTVRTESKDLASHHHFAFLISNFSFKRGFHPQSMGVPPKGLTLKFESGDEWLGIRDWGLGAQVTGS